MVLHSVVCFFFREMFMRRHVRIKLKFQGNTGKITLVDCVRIVADEKKKENPPTLCYLYRLVPPPICFFVSCVLFLSL